jgi:hypothetical protein
MRSRMSLGSPATPPDIDAKMIGSSRGDPVFVKRLSVQTSRPCSSHDAGNWRRSSESSFARKAGAPRVASETLELDEPRASCVGPSGRPLRHGQAGASPERRSPIPRDCCSCLQVNDAAGPPLPFRANAPSCGLPCLGSTPCQVARASLHGLQIGFAPLGIVFWRLKNRLHRGLEHRYMCSPSSTRSIMRSRYRGSYRKPNCARRNADCPSRGTYWSGCVQASTTFSVARPGIEPGTPRFSDGGENPWLSAYLQDFFW